MAPEPPYTRLLAADFPASFRFYRDVLPKLTGATLAHGDESSGYASWEAGADTDITVMALFDRRYMAQALGTAELPVSAAAQDSASLVLHLADAAALDEAVALCVAAGARVVAEAQARPQWGPTMRTAHLRDPDGHLLELQTY
jgi:catechol 2,3-dioxygenase-like lactoylglutathione lyase family enzyme